MICFKLRLNIEISSSHQAKYMDNDLGEKNLMWSLRGSQSEKKLSNNLESADVTMFRRRLAEMGSSWLSQIFRNAYPVYSRSSTSNLEVLDSFCRPKPIAHKIFSPFTSLRASITCILEAKPPSSTSFKHDSLRHSRSRLSRCLCS